MESLWSKNKTQPDPDATLTEEDSEERYGTFNQGRWTRQEHALFIEGLVRYGNNWKKVQKNVGSRSSTQARSHAQKFFLNLKKEISRGKSKEERKKIIFEIFNNALSHLIFTPNEAFFENVEKLVYASEEDAGQGGKKRYRHHPHVKFDKSIIKYQKEKIFHVQKIKKTKRPVINIVTINVVNNANQSKNSNTFDLFFDSNELSTVNNSNLNNNSASSNNLYEEKKSVTNEFIFIDEDNMSFDFDMLQE